MLMKFEWNCFYNRRLVLVRLSSFLSLAEFAVTKRIHFFSQWTTLFITRCSVWFWDQRTLFNLWVGSYIFHSSLSQLQENSAFWAWSVSCREVGWLEVRTLCIVLRVHFKAFKTIVFNPLSSDRCRGGQNTDIPTRMKDFRVLHSFDLGKCKTYCVKGT